MSDAIIVDEVGIETGHYDGLFLKSAYQPVYSREGDLLVPVAVEGLVMPLRNGKSLPPQVLFERTPSQDRTFIESICRALHLRNYRNIGVDGLQLFLRFDLGVHGNVGTGVGEIRAIAKQISEIGMASRLLACAIPERALGPDKLVRLAAELRRHDIRIAIDGFGSGGSDIERVDLIQPDIVRLDGAWFRKIGEVAETARLLPALVAGFRQRGIAVLFEGIETVWQLRIVLDAGADFFQGHLLGKPALAGTIFDETPLSVDELTRLPGNVIPLRR